ncbi:MAG: hypothetical protein QXX69_03625 [Sulfolobales archaeon]
MSGEAFDEACKSIVELLKSRGGSADIKTIVEELEKRDISRATIYRALEKLINDGIVKRVERGAYQLVGSDYMLLAEELSKEFCTLIKCESAEKLRRDLIDGLGSELMKIDKIYYTFINDTLPSLRNLGVSDILVSLLTTLYRSKAFLTLILMGSIKLMVIRKLINEGCSDIFAGLPENYVTFIKRMLDENVRNFEKFFKMDVDDAYTTLIKLKEILDKNGFKDVVWVRVIVTDIPLNVTDMVILSLTIFFSELEKIGVRNITQCAITLYKISDSLIESGCRPLGVKEREALTKNCEDVVKLLIK